MSNLKQNGELRWAPSYLRRRGQMTRAQKIAWRENWDDFGITFEHDKTIDLELVYPGGRPLVVEIGFGMGENLIHLATTNSNCRFLGIEVHKPGIGAALKSIAEQEISNTRVMRGDARLILEDHIVTPAFDRVLIFFPDPWPNPGDTHRRLFQEDFVSLLESRMKPEATLHLATDVDSYADWASEIMAAKQGWKTAPDIEENWQRIASKYEQKGLACGNRIHDLAFSRIRNV
ncbi:tRNA (guanosine(46)-N7)-methyltransferase TrmB [Verrucomicrobiales bacterium]|nr:tRNA (guanosine(46)-N7)-methyltransferase TrmB [Verrucomicrobiales bacterium]MDC0276695.1 tRNA (guanosine(46)-N7)-methyltransferase TrmB [Verrucomicrobiales bacterium]MDC0321725.1 tRNA (guanosine(46)-N7)-methyltransferase TrmB [Verrucomicrobiales bacterium]